MQAGRGSSGCSGAGSWSSDQGAQQLDLLVEMEAGGEGLIGLTRAFQYAGAHSVLASLWSVADASTAALMSRFYENLEQGADRTEALRKAQRDLIRGPVSLPGEAEPGQQADATHPFFWAAFQLFGDWR